MVNDHVAPSWCGAAAAHLIRAAVGFDSRGSALERFVALDANPLIGCDHDHVTFLLTPSHSNVPVRDRRVRSAGLENGVRV